MIDKRHAELIHRSIDGELTGAERSELDRCLNESVAARAFYEKMLILQRAGQIRQDVPPPPELKQAVMRRIRSRRPISLTKSARWQVIRNALRPLFVPRVAYGLAAGVLLGVVVGTLTMSGIGRHTGQESTLDFSGALGLPQTVAKQERLSSDVYSGGGLSIEWTADKLGYQVMIRLRLTSESACDVDFRFNAGQVVTQAFSQAGPGLAPVDMAPGSIHLNHTGEGLFTVLFSVSTDTPESVGLRITTGESVYTQTIPLTVSH